MSYTVKYKGEIVTDDLMSTFKDLLGRGITEIDVVNGAPKLRSYVRTVKKPGRKKGYKMSEEHKAAIRRGKAKKSA